ncbi:MAG: hypothetical protein ABR548_12125 [Actinomycetota bacterium]|nr:hypothetical protein [Actinomycetota bacterium]
MRRGKLGRTLVTLSIAAGTLVPLITSTSAHATGGSYTGTDRAGDTINYAAHPQNTLRAKLDSPCGADYCHGDPTDTTSTDPLNKPAIKPLDITGYYMDAGLTRANYYTARMTVAGNILQNGDPLTALPKGFTGVDYTWYFTTDLQDTTQDVGDDCSPLEANQSVDRYSRIYATKYTTNGQTCPGALTPGDEDHHNASAGNVAVLEHNQVIEVPHYASDHWWMTLAVSIEAVNDGPGPNPGNHFCKAVSGVTPPQCLRSYVRWGVYEGYSGVTSLYRQDQNVGPAISGPTYLSASQVQIQVPYNPQFSGGVDDDLLVDDTQIFPTLLGASGHSVTSLVAEITGSVQVGTPTVGVNRVCPAGTSFTPEGPLPPAAGLPSNVSPDKDNKTCANYLTGLLTLQDWAPDNGVELRAYPRAWAYLPSASSTTCRYPIGQSWMAASGAPVALAAATAPEIPGQAVIGQSSSGDNGPVGLDATPYERPWSVELVNNTFPASGGAGSRSQIVAPQTVPGQPGLSAAHRSQSLVVGTNNKCNYTDWPFGIHTFQNSITFPMG